MNKVTRVYLHRERVCVVRCAEQRTFIMNECYAKLQLSCFNIRALYKAMFEANCDRVPRLKFLVRYIISGRYVYRMWRCTWYHAFHFIPWGESRVYQCGQNSVRDWTHTLGRDMGVSWRGFIFSLCVVHTVFRSARHPSCSIFCAAYRKMRAIGIILRVLLI